MRYMLSDMGLRIKIVIISFILVMMLVVFSGCSGTLPEDPTELENITIAGEKILDENNILIVCDEAFAPFEFKENGELKGISVDLARETIRRMGYNISVSSYSWPRAVEMVETGQAHGIISLYKSKEREKWALFPIEPIFVDKQYFYGVPGAEIRYDGTIDSLKNYTIGITRGYSYGDAFDDAVNNNLLKTEAVDINPANIEKVMNGRIDAFIESEYITLYYLKQAGMGGELIELAFLRETELYLGFSKKKVDQDFVNHFDQVLGEMKKDGSYDEIVSSYDQYIR